MTNCNAYRALVLGFKRPLRGFYKMSYGLISLLEFRECIKIGFIFLFFTDVKKKAPSFVVFTRIEDRNR